MTSTDWMSHQNCPRCNTTARWNLGGLPLTENGYEIREYRFTCPSCQEQWLVDEVAEKQGGSIVQLGDVTYRKDFDPLGWYPVIAHQDNQVWNCYSHHYREHVHVIPEELVRPACAHLRTVISPPGKVHRSAFHPSGNFLALCLEDGPVGIYDANSGKLIRNNPGGSGRVNCKSLSYSADGEVLAATFDDRITGWYHKSGSQYFSYSGVHNFIHTTSLGKRRPLLLEVSPSNSLQVRDFSRDRIVFSSTPLQGEVTAVALHPTENMAAAMIRNAGIQVWAWQERFPGQARGQLVTSIPNSGWILDLEFSSDGRFLAAANSADISEENVRVYLYDSGTGRFLAGLNSHRNSVWDVEFSQNGKWLVTAGEDELVTLWALKSSGSNDPDPVDGIPVRQDTPLSRVTRPLFQCGWAYPCYSQNGLSLSKDGMAIAIPARNNALEIWDILS